MFFVGVTAADGMTHYNSILAFELILSSSHSSRPNSRDLELQKGDYDHSNCDFCGTHWLSRHPSSILQH